MYVGLLMLSNVAKIDFADFVDAMAGLVTAVFIVLTCNIVTGIMIGFSDSGDWSSGFRRMAQVEHRYGRYCRGAGDLLCGWLGYLILHRILKTVAMAARFFSPHIV